MSTNQHLRVTGIAFLCCSLGGLLAALVAREPLFLSTALPCFGLGAVFLGKSRQP